MREIMKAPLTAIIVSALFVSLMATGACPHPVRADITDFIRFDSGVTIFSPTNRTYNSRNLTLNLTLYSAGVLGSIDPRVSVNYDIDGICNGLVPLKVDNPGLHVVTGGAGIVNLPELPKGSHCLTISLEGLNQKTHEPKYLSYVNTVYFAIDDSNLTPTATPTLSPSPSPDPTPTPIPTPSPSPTPSTTQTPSPSPSPTPSIFPSSSPTQQPTLEPSQTAYDIQFVGFTPTIILYALVPIAVVIGLLAYFAKHKGWT